CAFRSKTPILATTAKRLHSAARGRTAHPGETRPRSFPYPAGVAQGGGLMQPLRGKEGSRRWGVPGGATPTLDRGGETRRGKDWRGEGRPGCAGPPWGVACKRLVVTNRTDSPRVFELRSAKSPGKKDTSRRRRLEFSHWAN